MTKKWAEKLRGSENKGVGRGYGTKGKLRGNKERGSGKNVP